MRQTRLHRLFIVLGLLAAFSPARAADPKLSRLFEERFRWESREFPEEALRRGDDTWADRVTDQRLEAIERRQRETTEHLTWLHAIDRKHLRGDDLVNYELFEQRLQNEVDAYRFRMFLAPIGQASGPHRDIPRMASGVRFATAKDYDSYFARLRGAAAEVDHLIERMKIGLAEGRTPPRLTLETVPGEIASLLEDDGLAALAAPLDHLPSHFEPERLETYQVKLRYEAMPEIRAALERLGTFLTDEYIPGCRESIAATALPDGDAYYAYELRVMTTTEMTAEEIHALGLSEVARIRNEMMAVIRRSDYLELHSEQADLDDDALFAAFIDYLRTDDRFYYDSPEALLTGYRDICKRIDGWLPKLFRTLPRLTYGVRAIPAFIAPNTTTAYYEPGSIENGEPGWFCANTYALDQRPKYEMIALAMHEAVPGHHLQSALAQELHDVPDFRRYSWYNAYGEGWALYAERLGLEMGMYEDPYDDFGRLLYEMWRACRLVVDPGMHALGWSRDEAVAYMLENTALSRLNIETEVDRYIAWPGQACGYTIGELKIRELREKVERLFGRNFDIREFHDVILGAGSLPLTVLERRVKDWVRSKPGGMAYD